MRLACTFTVNYYGHSGNEQMPPIVGGRVYTFASNDGEPEDTFKKRMQELGMRIRDHCSTKIKVEPYSIAPSCGWSYSVLLHHEADAINGL